MNAILNFATEFFEMLTKKQSEHLQTVFQVFQVFRVFQVFHFAFGPQNRPVLVQIRTKPTNRYPPTSAIKWVRKTPKKAIHPLVYEHDTVLQAIGAVLFSAKPTFCSLPSHPSHHPTQASPNQAPTIKIAEKGKSRVCSADFFKISLAHILRICYLCAINCKHTVNRVLQSGC